jgi:hypothetical protein
MAGAPPLVLGLVCASMLCETVTCLTRFTGSLLVSFGLAATDSQGHVSLVGAAAKWGL